MITDKEISLVRGCLDFALASGASAARATLSRSVEDLVSTLDGEIDKVTHCEDSSISLALFVDSKFGTFSTNKIGKEALESFIIKAIDTVRMLSEDELRTLPDPSRYCTTAITGDELDVYDTEHDSITMEDRRKIALGASVFNKYKTCPQADPVRENGRESGIPSGANTDPVRGFTVVSEEAEYSDSVYDCYVADTQGLSCRHRESCYDYGVEVTVENENGDKYSSYWWTSAEKLKDFDASGCCETALRRAVAKIGADCVESGKYNLVVESEVASKLVSPILRALNGYSLQQHNSFLEDSLGKQPLPEGLTIVDMPHIKGNMCSKLFDAEGIATKEGSIVDKGEVKTYFLNTYMAAKMGMAPTVDDAVRPKVMPWPKAGLGKEDIMKMCGSGILVTDFNGGNSNSATGDFSYGVEGFFFEDGRIVCPVSEMLITGNFLTLWNNLIACGDDARRCMSKLIPTLAFSNVDFSG